MSAQSQQRAQILNDFQSITGLNFDDAILFLEQYNWQLDKITDDYYDGIDLKSKRDYDSSLGRFYSFDDESKAHTEDSDRYYAELLSTYGDADEWRRKQQTEPIYHEKQRLMRCGLHSLNNLFQTPKLFTPHNLETIVRQYDKRTLFNDYRSLWLGNYDLRILIEAINQQGYHVRQIDIYQGESLDRIPWNTLFGLLVNLNGTHWFTIKNLNGMYYNLDSTLRKPKKLGDENNLIVYLNRLIHRTQTVHLFTVTSVS